MRLVLYLLLLCNIVFVFLQSCRFAFSICSLSPLCGDEIQQRTLQSKMNFTNIFISIWQIYWLNTEIYQSKIMTFDIHNFTVFLVYKRKGTILDKYIGWMSMCLKKYNHIWQINLLIVEMYYSIKAIQHFSTNILGGCEAASQ